MAGEIVSLVDCTHADIGTAVIGAPTEAGYEHKAEELSSGGDDMAGNQVIDSGAIDITCNVAGEDPLSVPVVLTAAGGGAALAVSASGRKAGTSTFGKFSVAHGVLVGVDLSIQDGQSGTVKYDFQNRAAGDSTELSDELSFITGLDRAVATRGRTIRFAQTGHAFTPDGVSAVNLLSLLGITWRMQPSQKAAKPNGGSRFVDRVDVLGWKLSGQAIIGDEQISVDGLLAIGNYLCTLGRGTLAVVLEMAGSTDGGTAPPNQIGTFERVRFTGCSGGRKHGADYNQATINFNAVLRTALGVAMTPAQMLTFAAEV